MNHNIIQSDVKILLIKRIIPPDYSFVQIVSREMDNTFSMYRLAHSIEPYSCVCLDFSLKKVNSIFQKVRYCTYIVIDKFFTIVAFQDAWCSKYCEHIHKVISNFPG